MVSSQSTENLINTFGSAFGNDDLGSSGTRIALRTEEEQQAAARKRETDERSVLEKETKDRREARRKSLANRRVSFAAEATLHTFHEVEFMQESTTSTDSTRRASSSTAQLSPQTQGPTPSSLENTDPPSTPPPGQENLVPETPEHQGDLHQKKRRRSSTGSTLNFHGRDDDTLSSTVYSSDSDGTDDVIETHEEIHSDSGSDSDDDGTTMDLDLDEMTGTSIASGRSNWTERSMDSDNDTLDGALRLAQRQAQTQSIDEEEEIIPSFGWAKKPAPIQRDLLQVRPLQGQPVTSRVSEQDIDQSDDGGGDMDMDMDMDMTHAIGGIIKSTVPGDDLLGGEMSMDVTKVLGGIISQQAAHLRQQSLTPDQDNEGSAMEDATMEMTMALGGIRQAQPLNNDLIELESNADYEDMSMELTTVIDGALASKQTPPSRRKSSANRRRTMLDDGSPMDMTVGLGRILMAAQIEEFADNEDEATMGMDMPTAIGEIIEYPFLPESRGLAKQAMEEEANQTDATPVAANSPSKRRLSALVNTGATPETGSPGLSAFRGKSLRHSTNQKSKPSSPIRTSSPVRSSSPFKELTPKSKPPSSPLKTPPGRRSPSRSLSPQRSAILESATPRSAPRSLLRTGLFQQDPSTGISTPRHVLTPQARRLSGLGIDRPGLGSPKVAQIMDRRGSIGEAAVDFVPGKIGRGVSFADPRIIADEVDQERREDEDRESSRRILEREANGDDDNTTATLKDMISSMSPKKNKSVPLRGRKSLHVGSAMGLLGKRPTELDSDDDRDDSAVIKRLKGLQNSPVKNIRLNAPPSKAETTGRTLRSSERVLEEIGGNVGTPAMALSPKKANAASSPQATDRFKHVGDQPTITFSFEEPHRVTEFNIQDDDGEHIHLQDFLNMTSIRFMELTTTKRRHTQAPTGLQDSTLHEDGDVSLERCVVAGACTVPMLELYQHSCRELKKYISEGRRIIREIETETFEENPPLFKEYIAASPDFKMLMDNQFKNVKTHARLLSKAMWYEWRMKLQDGLKEGLVKIAEGMNDDEQLLQREEELLQSTLPELIKQFEALEVEGENLQAIAQEIADCDPEDLQNARAELVDVDADIEAKMHQIEELQSSLKETESATEEFTRRKQNCIASIEEAEQVREECRGWTPNEINALKGELP